ncbi:MAG: AlpA family phage regulatory protein [Burkholderiales bacterium]|nr:AlpA family phage regulatory protein [Burkholderiales bacterium]
MNTTEGLKMGQFLQEALFRKQQALLRKREVLKLLGISNSSFYAYIKKGLIKPGVPIGPRLRGWPESEILGFIESCIAARDQKQGSAA